MQEEFMSSRMNNEEKYDIEILFLFFEGGGGEVHGSQEMFLMGSVMKFKVSIKKKATP